MKILNTGTQYQIYDSSIRTYDLLPTGTYAVGYNQNSGCYLIKRDNIYISEKTYGTHAEKADKVMNSFKAFERNLGVILSGDKGIGKSMFAKLLCIKAIQHEIPVIVIDACYEGIARFIESIDQECLILFDEFDKTFRSTRDNDDQSTLLSLFDGTAGGKKLFIVTCNELYGLNNFIVNRPGRFHYHFRFEYPGGEEIRNYLSDKLDVRYHSEINKVVEFAQKVSLNYDCLRAIAFELNYGRNFADAIADLNIMTTEEEEYKVYLIFENGKSLHNLKFQTNLYDYDGSMTYISLYDNDGNFVLAAHFDKGAIRYDMSSGKIMVSADAIKLTPKNNNDVDYDDYDDEDNETDNVKSAMDTYQGSKVLYMTFTKRTSKNLHYII